MTLFETAPKPDEFELTPPQLQALDNLQESRAQGITSGYLDMATGTGKTLVAAYDTKKYLDINPDGRILYLCHKGSILRQAHDTFSSILDTGSHGYFFGGEYQDQEQVVYATFQSMTRKLGGGHVYEAFDKREFKYIVVDEGHHGPANTYKPAIEYFEPDFLLGLTPTPERRDQRDLKEIFGPAIYRVGLEEAIANGHLAKPDYRLMADNIRKLETTQEQLGAVSLKEITKNLFIPKREEEIVATILRQMEEIENPRTVIFCPGIEYSERLSKLLPSNAKALHSRLSPELQDKRLEQFRSGLLSTLLVVDQLNEGVDVPEINFMVFLRSTESRAIFLQQLGRGLRKIPGKDSVRILDFAGSWDRIKMVKDLEQNVKEHYTKGPQQLRTIDQSFEFNFSDDAYNAIQIIEKARDSKKSKPQPIEKPRAKQQAEDEANVKRMLGLSELQNQRVTAAEFKMYGLKIAAGDENAKQEFILRRLRHVYRIARGYPEDQGLITDDYFQIGLEGLVDAVNKFDPNKHNDFKSYIDMSAWRFIERKRKESGLIRVPEGILKDLNNLRKAEEKFRKEHGREPTIDELAGQGGLNEKEIAVLKFEYGNQEYNSFQPIEVAEDMPDEAAELSLVEGTEANLTKKQLADALENLSYRERRVLELRYGIVGEEPKSLDDVGRTFNVTRERLRQLENIALKKLQSLAGTQGLREVYGPSAEGVRTKQQSDQDYKNLREARKIAEGNPERKIAVRAVLQYLQISPQEKEKLRQLSASIEHQAHSAARTEQQPPNQLQDLLERLTFVRNIRKAREYRSAKVMEDIKDYIDKSNNPDLWRLLEDE
jgi:RNA polymerase sigma factor (sigma-70 family)